MDYGYVAYIDEAGDPGLKKVLPIDEGGSSEWIILSAVIIRAKWEPEVASWVDGIRQQVGVRQRSHLHFRDLSQTRKLAVASMVSDLPLRGIVVCSNKKNMRGYRNTNAEKIPSQEWFYNWCVRLLLERVTAFCDQRRAIDYPGEAPKIKIEFSRRGGHRYSQTRAYALYLRHQEQAGSLFLTKRQIVTDMLSTDLMEDHPHWSRPGLQLADTLASAFFQASNTIGPGPWDTAPALALSKIMAKEKQRQHSSDFGVCLQPTPAWKGRLTADQRQVYEAYGYSFERW